MSEIQLPKEPLGMMTPTVDAKLVQTLVCMACPGLNDLVIGIALHPRHGRVDVVTPPYFQLDDAERDRVRASLADELPAWISVTLLPPELHGGGPSHASETTYPEGAACCVACHANVLVLEQGPFAHDALVERRGVLRAMHDWRACEFNAENRRLREATQALEQQLAEQDTAIREAIGASPTTGTVEYAKFVAWKCGALDKSIAGVSEMIARVDDLTKRRDGESLPGAVERVLREKDEEIAAIRALVDARPEEITVAAVSILKDRYDHQVRQAEDVRAMVGAKPGESPLSAVERWLRQNDENANVDASVSLARIRDRDATIAKLTGMLTEATGLIERFRGEAKARASDGYYKGLAHEIWTSAADMLERSLSTTKGGTRG